MDQYGFVRVAAASPEMRVGDCEFNKKRIIEIIQRADQQQVEFLVLPELCITGYTCADLFRQTVLQEGAVKALQEITDKTQGSLMVVMVGLPLNIRGRLFNCAAVIQDGKLLGIVTKPISQAITSSLSTDGFLAGSFLISRRSGLAGKQYP